MKAEEGSTLHPPGVCSTHLCIIRGCYQTRAAPQTAPHCHQHSWHLHGGDQDQLCPLEASFTPLHPSQAAGRAVSEPLLSLWDFPPLPSGCLHPNFCPEPGSAGAHAGGGYPCS